MNDRKQNSTGFPVQFFMTSATDHISGATGLTPTVVLSKNGVGFAAAAGAVSEVGNGWYGLAGNATDRNTLGELVLHATAAGADPTERQLVVVPWDPFDPNLALQGLAGTTTPAAGSIITSGSTTTPDSVSINAIGTLVTAVKAVADDLMTGLQADGLGGFQWTTTSLLNAPGGGSSDPLAQPVPGSYATGTAGRVLGLLYAAVAAMPQGLAGSVQDVAPTTSGCKTSGLPAAGTYPAAGATLQIIFTSGALVTRDFRATYTAGSAGTQALAFVATLPAAPANGDTFVALEIPG